MKIVWGDVYADNLNNYREAMLLNINFTCKYTLDKAAR